MRIEIYLSIQKQIPTYLNKWATALNETIEEIKSDYIFSMKKAVVDFVLKDSIAHLTSLSKEKPTFERKEVNALSNKYRYRYCIPIEVILSLFGLQDPKDIDLLLIFVIIIILVMMRIDAV